MANHLAAIHVLSGKIGLSDDDYRALLLQLTGQRSAKACSEAQQRQVREHLQRLAEKLGVAQPRASADAFAARQAAATPMERKVWALWHQLGRDGVIANPSGAALRAWVKRQTGMDDLKFCNWAQRAQLIEALKQWQERGHA